MFGSLQDSDKEKPALILKHFVGEVASIFDQVTMPVLYTGVQGCKVLEKWKRDDSWEQGFVPAAPSKCGAPPRLHFCPQSQRDPGTS